MEAYADSLFFWTACKKKSMIVSDVKPILNPYLAMTSEKYLKEVTVGPVSALSGKVVLEEYDAAWKGIFEEEKEKIGRALGRAGLWAGTAS